ncbi:MAG: GNAT family N-acetyltransferase [Marmoricola sp.]
MLIEIDDPARDDVSALLAEHMADMVATSPPESVHALDVSGLKIPEITFWTSREDGVLLGCGALKELDPAHAEIKSMRTTHAARGRGVASGMLLHLLAVAQERGYERLSLETGAEDYFETARRMYARHGFTLCEPFGSYRPDPNSVFMTRVVSPSG